MALVENLPQRIAAARELAGMNQAQLAAKLKEQAPDMKLGKDTISNIERGKRDYVRREELRAIARACDLPMAFFDDDLWLLEDLGDALNGLPEELLSKYTPQELVTFAFAALVEKHRAGEDLAAATLDYRLGVLERALREHRMVADQAVDDVERRVRELVAEALQDARASLGATQEAVNVSRRVKRAAAGQVEPASEESAAAADTRDEAGATPEESPTPREAKR